MIRRCKYLLRTQKLHELCKQADKKYSPCDVNQDTLHALEYLRLYVTPLVNYENKEEFKHFKQLCTHLCLSQDNDITKSDSYSSKSTIGKLF